jgi:hypothetical protein
MPTKHPITTITPPTTADMIVSSGKGSENKKKKEITVHNFE